MVKFIGHRLYLILFHFRSDWVNSDPEGSKFNEITLPIIKTNCHEFEHGQHFLTKLKSWNSE